jgi:predicted Zn-dependent protease with MMP-like domain
MEDGEEPETGAEMARVMSDVLKRVGNRAEQEVVNDLGVLEGKGRKGLGQGEDHVGIGHR